METAEALARILTEASRGGAQRLSREDLRELPAVYRRAVSELAEARARAVSPDQLSRLEMLIVRAHGLIYAREPTSLLDAARDLLLAFPAAVRRSAKAIAVAFALLAAGAGWGYWEARRNPASSAVLLPGCFQDNAENFRDDAKHREGDPVYGVFYFTNNATVALRAYALGSPSGLARWWFCLSTGYCWARPLRSSKPTPPRTPSFLLSSRTLGSRLQPS